MDAGVRIRGVLFDMGGTLFGYTTHERLRVPTLTAFERLGLDLTDPAVREAHRQAADEVEREYARRRSFLHRDLFRDRLARTAQLLGITAPADVVDRFADEQRDTIIEHLVPRTDAHDTLVELRTRGLYLAVVSNIDDDMLGPVLRRHGIDVLVDHWTSSEEAASCKPDTRIFEVALTKAGLSARDAVYVGDSPHHDVAGARAAGLRSVLLGEPGSTAPLSRGLGAPPDPDHVVASLIEVLSVVDDLNAGGRAPR